VGGGGAPQERKREAREPNGSRFLPLELEDRRIELCAGQERQDYSGNAGEEFDPRLICTQHSRADGSADNQLRDRSDDDLRQGGRDAEPDRKQACDYRKA